MKFWPRVVLGLFVSTCAACSPETPVSDSGPDQGTVRLDAHVAIDRGTLVPDLGTGLLDARTGNTDGGSALDSEIGLKDANLIVDSTVDAEGQMALDARRPILDVGGRDGAFIDAALAMDGSRPNDAFVIIDEGLRDSQPPPQDMSEVEPDLGLPEADLGLPEADMAVEDNPCNDPVAGSRCRINGRCITAGSPLTGSPCRICLPALDLYNWSVDETSPVCLERAFWTDIAHAAAQTPHERRVGVVCHNCYHQPGPGDNPADSEVSTRAVIRDAQFAGADLIELDLKEENGRIYVDHDDDGGTGGAHFDAVLQNDDLRRGSQPLYLELKELDPGPAFVETMLRDLMRFGYAVAGRPVFLRAFYDRRESLLLARQILAGAAFAPIRPYVRLNVLFRRNNPAAIADAHTRILDIRNMGMHGVEFYYDDNNLLSKIAYARALGLGVTLFTVPVRMGEVFIANSRDLVDALVVDYPIESARTVIEEQTSLVNLDVSAQDGAMGLIRYQRTGPQYHNLRVDGPDGPTIESLGPGEDRYGGSLVFEANEDQSLTLYDADTRAGEGYFVSILVNFDELGVPDGETRSLIAKSDGGGFAIELYNPPGLRTTVLRFGVRVGANYYYATYTARALNGTDAYWITGSYDGDGAVRMWVNNSDDGVSSSDAIAGGVVNNNSPIVIGADPQGAEIRRFHSSAKIQRVNIQRWRNH